MTLRDQRYRRVRQQGLANPGALILRSVTRQEGGLVELSFSDGATLKMAEALLWRFTKVQDEVSRQLSRVVDCRAAIGVANVPDDLWRVDVQRALDRGRQASE